MKKFYLLLTFFGLFSFQFLSAQNAGDYRSNVVVGNWTTPGTWQIYNGTAWVAATAAPTSADGVVSILGGDSIRITTPVTVDQIVIAAGSVLAVNGAAATLNDDPSGDDLIVNGRLYIGASTSSITGAGTIMVNSGGLFVVRNSGIVAVNTTNNGETDFSLNTFVQSPVFTNNNSTVWQSGNIALTSSSFVNNGLFDIQTTAAQSFNGNVGSSFTNASGAVIFAENTGGTASFLQNVNFTNSGSVKGNGVVSFNATTLANTGTIDPGNAGPGILTINPAFATGKSPIFNLNIENTGGTAGTNYDQVAFSGATNANVTGSTLTVTDNGNDPVGTVYTLVTSASGTITGPFASVNLPASMATPVFTSNSVTVQRIGTLPLVWGDFTAIAQKNSSVLLSWTTLQETNTAYFSVEYSTDGTAYNSIGKVTAKGNSASLSSYSFVHTSPVSNGANFYRLNQVDLDGKSTYSTVKRVSFYNGKTVPVTVTPNPVLNNTVQFNVQAENIRIDLVDLSGKQLKSWILQKGQHEADVQSLPRGVYQLIIYQGDNRIDAQRLLKL